MNDSDGVLDSCTENSRRVREESEGNAVSELPAVPLYKTGDRVCVRRAYPIGHCRTPAYFRGAKGVVERHCGAFANPEELAYGRPGTPPVHLYRVRARQSDLWPAYEGSALDTIEVEVFEHWLAPLVDDVQQGRMNNREEDNEQ